MALTVAECDQMIDAAERRRRRAQRQQDHAASRRRPDRAPADRRRRDRRRPHDPGHVPHRRLRRAGQGVADGPGRRHAVARLRRPRLRHRPLACGVGRRPRVRAVPLLPGGAAAAAERHGRVRDGERRHRAALDELRDPGRERRRARALPDHRLHAACSTSTPTATFASTAATARAGSRSGRRRRSSTSPTRSRSTASRASPTSSRTSSTRSPRAASLRSPARTDARRSPWSRPQSGRRSSGQAVTLDAR